MKENFYNTKSKIRYRAMIRGGRPIRNKDGEIVKPADFQNTTAPVGKIHADRKWFSSTRLVLQSDLDKFKDVSLSPYEVLLKKGKVPFCPAAKTKTTRQRVDFQKVFGKRSTRKKPTIDVGTLEELKSRAENRKESATQTGEEESRKDEHGSDAVRGQSRRIWNELYNVIDCSDVVVHVLDARDPPGTRCASVEKYLDKNAPFKYLVYLINKVDLVPTRVTARWLNTFSTKHPVLAYHSNSLSNFYGQENLIGLLRQYSHLKKRQISVGFVGYPNVGKSSIINTLRRRVVCSVAPVPGQTKVYQYITLTKKIYLIDSPGVVPTSTLEEAVLRGAMRVENLDDPEYFFMKIYEKAKSAMEKVYGISSEEALDFLEKYCRKFGKLLKGGACNIDIASKLLLHDWIRGKIPYYVEPPPAEEKAECVGSSA